MNQNKRQKREKEIKIRLSNHEHDRLMARKNQRSLAGWIRDFCLTQKETMDEKVILELDPITRRNLSGISTNINQMAKRVNSGNFKPTDIPRMLVDLKSCRDILERIQTEIRNNQS